MRRWRGVVIVALLTAPLLAACGEPSPPAPAAAAWDRDAARREVLAAALDALAGERDVDDEGSAVVVDGTLRPTRSYDEAYVPGPGRSADMVSLPSKRKVFPPQVETLAAETFDDWVAHTAPVPAPRDLSTPLSIEWRAEAGSSGRVRSSRSSTFIELSDVGFSPSHDQALLQASRSGESSTSGFWLLLRRTDDRWVLVQRKRTFIACGCAPPANITPSER